MSPIENMILALKLELQKFQDELLDLSQFLAQGTNCSVRKIYKSLDKAL